MGEHQHNQQDLPVATPAPVPRPVSPWIERASYIAAAGMLLVVLKFGLLASLLSGLAVYTCVHALAPLLPVGRSGEGTLARQVALGLVSIVLIGIMVGSGMWLYDFLRGTGSGVGLHALMSRMGEILLQLHETLPEWATRSIPDSARALNDKLAEYFMSNADMLQTAGQGLLKSLTHVILGAVLGGMVAISQASRPGSVDPLATALRSRIQALALVFRQVVGAQLRISLINTVFTAIFLLIVLPLTGNPLPFTKTMILITFVAGLIPVLGNLISNTVITVIALSVSLWVAAGALAFLVIIHKLEYFLNAKIIGTQVQARAWELLAAMLVMEACFGLAGVIAAPIFYAYAKRELRLKEMI